MAYNPDLSNLQGNVKKVQAQFAELFPDLATTSGFRSAGHNHSVGGAKGSAHLHGYAFDFVPNGNVPDERKADAVNWLRSQGATGLGTYKDGSFHADFKPGANRAWGPNRSYTSLDQTPEWFQSIANDHRSGVAPSTKYATIPPGSIPNVKLADTAPSATPSVPDVRRTGAIPSSVPQDLPTVGDGTNPYAGRAAAMGLPQRPMGALPTRSPFSGDGVLPKMVRFFQDVSGPTPANAAEPRQSPSLGQTSQGDTGRLIPVLGASQPTPQPMPVPAPVQPPAPTQAALPARPMGALPAAAQLFNPTSVQPPQAPAQQDGEPLVVRGIRPMAQPAPAPAPMGQPDSEPLVVRGIRPTSQQYPMPPQRPPEFTPQMVPLPPQRPADLSVLPQRPMGALPPQHPQGSAPTIWGANYHGPEGSLINYAQAPAGTPYPESVTPTQPDFMSWLRGL